MKTMKARIEFLNRIKLDALLLLNNRNSSYPGEALLVQADIENLVEEFFAGCGDLLSPCERDRAKSDIDYFLTLVDSTLERCRKESGEGETSFSRGGRSWQKSD